MSREPPWREPSPTLDLDDPGSDANAIELGYLGQHPPLTYDALLALYFAEAIVAASYHRWLLLED